MWYWTVYECAHFCVNNKLNTYLGDPNKTFLSIETVLNGYVLEIEQKRNNELSPDPPTVYSGSVGSGLGPIHYTVYLRAVLLLQFLEQLEKVIYNASKGSIVLPPVNRNVRVFFSKNSPTCNTWLSRIRLSIICMSLHCGQPALAVRNGFFLLQDNISNLDKESFTQFMLQLLDALIVLKAHEVITGLAKKFNLTGEPWIQGAKLEALGKYELAILEYMDLIGEDNNNSNINNSNDQMYNGRRILIASKHTIGFCSKRLLVCYSSLGSFEEVEKFFGSMHSSKKRHLWTAQQSELAAHVAQVSYNTLIVVFISYNIYYVLVERRYCDYTTGH